MNHFSTGPIYLMSCLDMLQHIVCAGDGDRRNLAFLEDLADHAVINDSSVSVGATVAHDSGAVEAQASRCSELWCGQS